jgi:8-oxo-dGTP pyrophosphatase MutT (NUDIX family)
MSFTASNTPKLMPSDDLPRRLALCWCERDFTARAGREFAPELSFGRHFGPAPSTARDAAVLLLLFRHEGRWRLPLIERPSTLAHHAGQFSLPGGSVEPGESSAAAARRELAEELGVETECEMIGKLSSVYVFASDFLITPWVASTADEMNWRPEASEVERVVELPLDVLFDPHSVGRMTIDRGPLTLRAPYYCYEDVCIWGATAIILAEFAALLRRAL